MGLFNAFKSSKNETNPSKTGIYSIDGKFLKPINELPKTGSYNDIAESLGFQTFHSILTFDSKKIEYIAFKRRTKEPIFIVARNKSQPLFFSDVTQIINEIDWEFEIRQLDFEDNNE
jgi:hypothetical protein